jgi:hypothetical protein
MTSRPKQALAWLPVLLVPFVLVIGSGLGCELLVNPDTMLVDGSPTEVIIPMMLDAYACSICKDVSPDAVFDGPFFPEAEPEDSARVHDSGAESSMTDSGARDGERADTAREAETEP